MRMLATKEDYEALPYREDVKKPIKGQNYRVRGQPGIVALLVEDDPEEEWLYFVVQLLPEHNQ